MKKVIATLSWVVGICLAGAEGAVWVNLLGMPFFCFGSFLLLESLDSQAMEYLKEFGE